MTEWNLFSNKQPARQGYYLVKTTDLTEEVNGFVAEWREHDKKQGKQWWRFVSDSPTEAKKRVLLEGVTHWTQATDAQVTEALRRELTKEEQIEKAYSDYKAYTSHHPQYAPLPNARRKLSVGDEVAMGGQSTGVVEALKEDGRVVIVSCRDVRSAYGQSFDNGTSYRAVHWLRVIPKKNIKATDYVRRPILRGAYSNRALDGLLSELVQGLDDAPEYQRSYVWSHEDQQRYLDSLMEGRDLGRFITVSRRYPHPDQLLDGKQRLNCLSLFVRSEIAWRGVYFDELSAKDRDEIRGRLVQVASIEEGAYTKADLLRIFLEVNTTGVPQAEEHLSRVREMLAQEDAKAVDDK